MKHPDVIAWEKWSSSEEGKMCSQQYCKSLEPQYLQNRLWRAFVAGRKKDDL